MSLITDKKFIDLISSDLRNFKWKKDSLSNCSCPICGDSKKDPKKARGYFYQKHGRFFYKCHNCGCWYNLYNFLKLVSPQLCKEYSLENIRESGFVDKRKKKITNNSKVENNENMIRSMKTPSFGKNPRDGYKILEGAECLAKLPSSHTAIKFANMRSIPKEYWNLLYYTKDFGSFSKRLDPESNYRELEERLVIPFFNSHGDVVAAQGRALTMSSEANARNTIKYLTVKADKSIDRLFYGLWRCNPEKRVYVVEGPLDSLFIKNAIAMVGASSINKLPERLRGKDIVFVLDNEPRNSQIVKFNNDLIKQGRQVCIWPDSVKEKDINDMSYRISTRKIRKMIDENTFNGIEAELRLKEWKKV